MNSETNKSLTLIRKNNDYKTGTVLKLAKDLGFESLDAFHEFIKKY